jgi:hypothetical protein
MVSVCFVVSVVAIVLVVFVVGGRFKTMNDTRQPMIF